MTPKGTTSTTPGSRRRTFLKAAVLAGLSVPGMPLRAAPNGGVIFGFAVTPSSEALMTTVVRRLRPLYRPDLGARPIFLPGNSGTAAMETVIRAPADGGTVLLSSSASMTLLPSLRKLSSEPADLLQPVAGVGLFTYAFIVGPAVPAEVRTMRDYLGWAKAHPSLATYGVPGRGTGSHFVGIELSRLGDVPLKMVAYKSLPSMLDDIASGSLPASVTLLPSATDRVRQPSIRVLAVTSAGRWPADPDVPTLVEQGLAEAPTDGSIGFHVSAETPADKVAELRDATRRIQLDDEVRQALAYAGLQPMPTESDYRREIAAERAEWQRRIAHYAFGPDS